MQVTKLAIPDVVLIRPRRFTDARGYFAETFSARAFREAVADVTFVQDNEALSTAAGTLRGLHFQTPPAQQGKLVRAARGRIFDVAVDIRTGSPTFGHHVSAILDEAGGDQLWVPEGFAHGYCTLDPDSVISYKVTAFYSGPHDGGIAWDDPALAIPWPVAPGAAVLSDKDRRLPRLAELPTVFTHGQVLESGVP